jgi:imidazolonepropionase-like amidohydrolase
MKKCIFLLLSFIFKLSAQTTFPVNGAPYITHTTYAFTNCNLHVDARNYLAGATLLIKDGMILEAGNAIKIPEGSIVKDLKGKHIYPAFIDLYSEYGMPDAKTNQRNYSIPQMESNFKGAYGWNQAIRSDIEADKIFTNNPKQANEYRKSGFAVVLTSQKDGIVRGSGVLVTLGNNKENENIIKDKAAAFYSFKKGSSTQEYPSSLMGSIALLRQTYYDAKWYKELKDKKEYNISLQSFNELQSLPQIFEANDKLTILRAQQLGDEFGIKYMIKGRGDEYQRAAEIAKGGNTLIVPLNFPDAYDVEDPYDAENIGIAELKHWEMAPANLKFLSDKGVRFAITSADLKDRKQFLNNLKKAINYGLTEEKALEALTSIPAELLGVQQQAGSLKKGMMANFFIASDNIFNENASVMETWVRGECFSYADVLQPDLRGVYQLTLSGKQYKTELKGEIEKPELIIYWTDSIKTKTGITYKNGLINFSFYKDSVSLYRFSGNYDESKKSIKGKIQNNEGNWINTELPFVKSSEEKKKEEKKKEIINTGEIYYPFTSFGKPEKEDHLLKQFLNRSEAILIKDATVWTNELEGVLKEFDVYVVEGKVVRIAENIEVPKTVFPKIIDAKGKHLTAGIIDEHSHIAISKGVNEGTKTSSAEVRIGDVINSEDINIYRQLAGGVTTAQLLHGSANPIGGQSALIKLRWGLSPEFLKYEKADGFIKFALGENVKQSNWGNAYSTRFPQTRMGVEQVYYDFFTRAKEYENTWNAFKLNNAKDKIAPRRDLELECLSEIINKKRFITCHSYVQSEINMLMKVADSMGFKVNTFTHILEGYKVADKMKLHGVSASTFADWWAYKMEVMDAIPYNAALLTKMGVNAGINSDDAEMGRRLNQEAAKAMKYGNLTEEEAWKLCTLNPAKMLHIDDKVGSIKAGKSADLVLWSDNPLSIYAKVEKTIIDGKIYFDQEEDVKIRESLQKERLRIITKMMEEKKKGGTLIKPTKKQQHLYHCDTMEE